MVTKDLLREYFDRYIISYDPYKDNVIYKLLMDFLFDYYWDELYNKIPGIVKDVVENYKYPSEVIDHMLHAIGLPFDLLSKLSSPHKVILLKCYMDFAKFKGTVGQTIEIAKHFNEMIGIYELFLQFEDGNWVVYPKLIWKHENLDSKEGVKFLYSDIYQYVPSLLVPEEELDRLYQEGSLVLPLKTNLYLIDGTDRIYEYVLGISNMLFYSIADFSIPVYMANFVRSVDFRVCVLGLLYLMSVFYDERWFISQRTGYLLSYDKFVDLGWNDVAKLRELDNDLHDLYMIRYPEIKDALHNFLRKWMDPFYDNINEHAPVTADDILSWIRNIDINFAQYLQSRASNKEEIYWMIDELYSSLYIYQPQDVLLRKYYNQFVQSFFSFSVSPTETATYKIIHALKPYHVELVTLAKGGIVISDLFNNTFVIDKFQFELLAGIFVTALYCIEEFLFNYIFRIDQFLLFPVSVLETIDVTHIFRNLILLSDLIPVGGIVNYFYKVDNIDLRDLLAELIRKYTFKIPISDLFLLIKYFAEQVFDSNADNVNYEYSKMFLDNAETDDNYILRLEYFGPDDAKVSDSFHPIRPVTELLHINDSFGTQDTGGGEWRRITKTIYELFVELRLNELKPLAMQYNLNDYKEYLYFLMVVNECGCDDIIVLRKDIMAFIERIYDEYRKISEYHLTEEIGQKDKLEFYQFKPVQHSYFLTDYPVPQPYQYSSVYFDIVQSHISWYKLRKYVSFNLWQEFLNFSYLFWLSSYLPLNVSLFSRLNLSMSDVSEINDLTKFVHLYNNFSNLYPYSYCIPNFILTPVYTPILFSINCYFGTPVVTEYQIGDKLIVHPIKISLHSLFWDSYGFINFVKTPSTSSLSFDIDSYFGIPIDEPYSILDSLSSKYLFPLVTLNSVSDLIAFNYIFDIFNANSLDLDDSSSYFARIFFDTLTFDFSPPRDYRYTFKRVSDLFLSHRMFFVYQFPRYTNMNLFSDASEFVRLKYSNILVNTVAFPDLYAFHLFDPRLNILIKNTFDYKMLNVDNYSLDLLDYIFRVWIKIVQSSMNIYDLHITSGSEKRYFVYQTDTMLLPINLFFEYSFDHYIQAEYRISDYYIISPYVESGLTLASYNFPYLTARSYLINIYDNVNLPYNLFFDYWYDHTIPSILDINAYPIPGPVKYDNEINFSSFLYPVENARYVQYGFYEGPLVDDSLSFYYYFWYLKSFNSYDDFVGIVKYTDSFLTFTSYTLSTAKSYSFDQQSDIKLSTLLHIVPTFEGDLSSISEVMLSDFYDNIIRSYYDYLTFNFRRYVFYLLKQILVSSVSDRILVFDFRDGIGNSDVQCYGFPAPIGNLFVQFSYYLDNWAYDLSTFEDRIVDTHVFYRYHGWWYKSLFSVTDDHYISVHKYPSLTIMDDIFFFYEISFDDTTYVVDWVRVYEG